MRRSTNQPEVAPGVPGMNATELVNAPLDPETKAFIARSNAERFDPGQCWRCSEARKEYDNEIRMSEPFLGDKTTKLLGLGERPKVNEAKWWIWYPSIHVKGAGEKKRICETCCDTFAAEVVSDYDTRRPTWKESTPVLRRPVVREATKAGLIIAGEDNDPAHCERYDVSLGGKWFHTNPPPPKKYPKAK